VEVIEKKRYQTLKNHIHEGKLIRKLRLELNMSQASFSAKFLGGSVAQVISNCERGICPLPLKYWSEISLLSEYPIGPEIASARAFDVSDLVLAFLANNKLKITSLPIGVGDQT